MTRVKKRAGISPGPSATHNAKPEISWPTKRASLLASYIRSKGIEHKGFAQRAVGTPHCTEKDAGGTATSSRRDRSSTQGHNRVSVS